jgi:histidinol phosphatase-like enzyme (inositol monophosphatase family)
MTEKRAVAERLEAALAIAREVGDVTLSYFQKPSLHIEMKDDGSPVTEADKLAEAMIRKHVARLFPGDGVLGEEEGETRGTSGYRWILDPIDGTRPFTRGIPTFGNLIAVEREVEAGDTTSLPEIVVGVAGFPAMHEMLWAGDGLGAWWETPRIAAQPMRVTRLASLDDAVVDSLSPQTWEKYGWGAAYDRLWRSTRRVRSWSDSYSFALVATGRVDAAVDFGAKIWDVAPFAVMMKEAGGVMSCFRGSPCLTTGTYIAGNGVLHAELMRIAGG